jgi:hypothetical protein
MLKALMGHGPAMTAAGFLSAALVVGGIGYAGVGAMADGSDLAAADAATESPTPTPSASSTLTPTPSATDVPPVVSSPPPTPTVAPTATPTVRPTATKSTKPPVATTSPPVEPPPPPPPPVTPPPVAGDFTDTWAAGDYAATEGAGLWPGVDVWTAKVTPYVTGQWTTLSFVSCSSCWATYRVHDNNHFDFTTSTNGNWTDVITYRVTGPGGSDTGRITLVMACNLATAGGGVGQVGGYPCRA